MRLFKTIFALAAVTAIAIAAESCSGNKSQTDIEFETRVDSVGYMMPDFYGDTVYAAAKYSVVWPEKIGKEDFDALRDSLLSLTFATPDATTFEDAARQYMLSVVREHSAESDTTFAYSKVPYDTAANAERSNESYIISDVTLLTPKVLVVQVYNYSYCFGAAHGMNTTRYLNYSIAAHKLLNAGNMFKPGNETAILDLINASAKEHYPEEGTLFPEPIGRIGDLQITEKDIVFVYQPYDVAPYSTGVVSIPVSQYDLHRFFTPEVIETLSEL